MMTVRRMLNIANFWHSTGFASEPLFVMATDLPVVR